MKINIELITNASLVINIDNQIKLATDPTLAPKGTSIGFGIKSKYDPVYNENTFKNIDMWLLTHNHKDHLDNQGLAVIPQDGLIVAPKAMNKFLTKHSFNNFNQLTWNEAYILNIADYQIKVTAIAAFHGHNKLAINLMGKVNGYLIEITKGEISKTIYLTADTVYSEKYKEVIKEIGKIDLLVLTLGGATPPLPISKKKITFTIEEGQQVIKLIKPQNCLAVHIDEYEHFTTTRKAAMQIADVINNGQQITYDI